MERAHEDFLYGMQGTPRRIVNKNWDCMDLNGTLNVQKIRN